MFIDKATLHDIEDILEHLIEDSECRYDHHGYCQEHIGGFSDKGCTNPRMKKVLEKLEKDIQKMNEEESSPAEQTPPARKPSDRESRTGVPSRKIDETEYDLGSPNKDSEHWRSNPIKPLTR